MAREVDSTVRRAQLSTHCHQASLPGFELALPLLSYVTLGCSFNFSESKHVHLFNRDNNMICLMENL